MKTIHEDFPEEFWCGCCACWRELSGTAVKRRVTMFNHLEDHLDGKNGQQVGGADTWQPKPNVCSQSERKVLRDHIRTTAGNGAISEGPSERPTSFDRCNARPPPMHASYSADNKRHPSASPTLRPQMKSKRLKSAGNPRRSSQDRADGETRSSRSGATVTRTCCQCRRVFESATCVCGHPYDNYCCQRRVDTQFRDEFAALDRGQDRDGSGRGEPRRCGRGHSASMYEGH